MTNTQTETLLKTALSKAKYYETEKDFLDDIKNGYIDIHANDKNVTKDAEYFKEDYYNRLTGIEDLDGFKWELEDIYGIDLDSTDEKTLNYELSGFVIVYIDSIETYYII